MQVGKISCLNTSNIFQQRNTNTREVRFGCPQDTFTKSPIAVKGSNAVSFGITDVNKKENEQFLADTEANIRKVCNRLKLSKAMTGRILRTETVEGEIKVTGIDTPIKCYLVMTGAALDQAENLPELKDDNEDGLAKGGIRFAENVDVNTIKALSLDMMIKNALAGLPLRGGKSGIAYDPTKLTAGQKEDAMRQYTRLFKDYIGTRYVPAPDMGTNADLMSVVRDEFKNIKGYDVPGCVTGKAWGKGGSAGRTEATGFGLVYALERAFELQGKTKDPLKGLRVAIQGSGNVGIHAALLLQEKGAHVVAIGDKYKDENDNDKYGTIYKEDGLDVKAVKDYVSNHPQKTVDGYNNESGVKPIPHEDLFALDNVDVIIPAAAQHQITEDNADKIKAKYIAEGANGPTTRGADVSLNSRTENKPEIYPDILMNQGGVVVSYFEQVQNKNGGEPWSKQIVLDMLQEHMTSRYDKVHKYAKEKNISMREAATEIAVEKIARAIKNNAA